MYTALLMRDSSHIQFPSTLSTGQSCDHHLVFKLVSMWMNLLRILFPLDTFLKAILYLAQSTVQSWLVSILQDNTVALVNRNLSNTCTHQSSSHNCYSSKQHNTVWFQASTIKEVRTALFWVIMQWVVVTGNCTTTHCIKNNPQECSSQHNNVYNSHSVIQQRNYIVKLSIRLQLQCLYTSFITVQSTNICLNFGHCLSFIQNASTPTTQ